MFVWSTDPKFSQSSVECLHVCIEVFCSHNLIQLVITMPTGQVESPADSRADNQPICESASGHSSGCRFNLTAYRIYAWIYKHIQREHSSVQRISHPEVFFFFEVILFQIIIKQRKNWLVWKCFGSLTANNEWAAWKNLQVTLKKTSSILWLQQIRLYLLHLQ